jgi:hypothetical protein
MIFKFILRQENRNILQVFNVKDIRLWPVWWLTNNSSTGEGEAGDVEFKANLGYIAS